MPEPNIQPSAKLSQATLRLGVGRLGALRLSAWFMRFGLLATPGLHFVYSNNVFLNSLFRFAWSTYRINLVVMMSLPTITFLVWEVEASAWLFFVTNWATGPVQSSPDQKSLHVRSTHSLHELKLLSRRSDPVLQKLCFWEGSMFFSTCFMSLFDFVVVRIHQIR